MPCTIALSTRVLFGNEMALYLRPIVASVTIAYLLENIGISRYCHCSSDLHRMQYTIALSTRMLFGNEITRYVPTYLRRIVAPVTIAYSKSANPTIPIENTVLVV